MNTANSLTDKRQAIVRSALFWVGFFVFFFLTRVVVGMIGERRGAGQWYGAATMTVLMIIWTRVCLRMDRRFDNPGTRFSRGSIPRTLLGLIGAAVLHLSCQFGVACAGCGVWFRAY